MQAALLRTAGLILAVAGLLVAGYAVGLALDADRHAAQAERQRDEIVRTVEGADPAGPAPDPRPPLGAGLAVISIPRLGIEAIPLLEGTGPEQLVLGLAHYPGTALPCSTAGVVGVAGHRSSASGFAPLADVDRLRPGDRVLVRTADGRECAYRLTHDRRGLPPSAVWVLRGRGPVLVLTTCEPRHGSTSRWVWWARLEELQ